ncbi:DMT family transporter [Bacillus spongiae]|uniref:DMT family transporter n=1 Tax=Bacillus spongiae TaxID=2683610 RepID=A0ABU8HCD6_9BACI
MKGIIIAILGGAFITLQGVANARISEDIGTWQTATVTHLTGFIMTLFILVFMKDQTWKRVKHVKPLYLTGGTLGAIIIFSNVTAIQRIGVTLSIAALLIAQLSLTFIIEMNGWFGIKKKRMGQSQYIGIMMMIVGVVILIL